MKKINLLVLFFSLITNIFSQCLDNAEVGCKVYLQGAYLSNILMDTSLNLYIPNSQPYDTLPWNYDGNENINPIPSNMVDWVLVELRDPGNPAIIISRKAGILKNNGQVLDTNLAALLNFPNINPGNYYLCIYHRNHFPVMSANPVAIPIITQYDFSDTLNFPPYGGGSNALIELETGVFGMIAGDVNKDGTIKYSGPNNDRGPVLQYIVNQSGSTSITSTVTGYREEDISMDSIIKYSGPGNDPSLIIQNLVGLTGTTSITSVYYSIVPAGVPPFQCGDTLVDQRDGQKYFTVQIGNQCWMAENLAYLPSVSPSSAGSNTTPYYYVYDYQGTDVSTAKATVNYQTYGVLYNWAAAMDGEPSNNNVPSGVQGVCPTGWHIPGDEEWKIPEGEVDSQYGYPDAEWDGMGWRGTDAGSNLKETGINHWNSPNTGSTNSSGFTALPGGLRNYNYGSYSMMGISAYYWTSLENNNSNAWYRNLNYNYTSASRMYNYKENGKSVRCLKDCSPQPSQSDAGKDSLNIVGDSIALSANNPVIGLGLWTIYSGKGGSFADSTDPLTLFYGLPGNTYLLVWTISNVCDSFSDTVEIGFATTPPQPCPGIPTLLYGGQVYNTVQIGHQCWMKENLNIGTRIDGVNDQTNNGTIEKYCFNDLDNNCNTYGGLYQWGEAMQYTTTQGGQGICPSGWHIPTDEDLKMLEGLVDSQYDVGDPIWNGTSWRGLDAGGNLKETGTLHWIVLNTGATNSSGFTALPVGMRYFANGLFYYLNTEGYIWSGKEFDGSNAWYRNLVNTKANVYRGFTDKMNGLSLRCLKDCTPQPTQSIAGQDTMNIPGDSIVLMANSAVIGQGSWVIADGVGGSFSDSTSPTSVFYGLPGNAYHLVWIISNICGSSSDTVVVSFTSQGWICGNSFIDTRDGQSYSTVQIGTQCWMRDNLNIGKPINSGYGSPGQTNNDTIEKCCYLNTESNCDIYGGLYEWNEMMQYNPSDNGTIGSTQGICPAGWHIPTDAERTALSDSLGGTAVAGGKMKEAGTTHWNNPNTGATNSSGFTALPGGYMSSSGSFSYLRTKARFWSATEYYIFSPWSWNLSSSNADLLRQYADKSFGFSVRCLKD